MFGASSTSRKMKPIPLLCTMSTCVPIDACRIWNVHFVSTSDIPPTCFGQTAGNAAVIYRQKELGAAPWRVLHQRIREWGVADDQHFPSIGAVTDVFGDRSHSVALCFVFHQLDAFGEAAVRRLALICPIS